MVLCHTHASSPNAWSLVSISLILAWLFSTTSTTVSPSAWVTKPKVITVSG